MTPRQHNLLQFFRAHMAKSELPPPYKQMAHALGVKSPAALVPHVQNLVRDGHLIRTKDYRGLALPPTNACRKCGHNHEEAMSHQHVYTTLVRTLPDGRDVLRYLCGHEITVKLPTRAK